MALAIVFAAATVGYSVAWMYYVRAVITVEVGMDTIPLPDGLKVRDVWHGSPAERAGLRANDLIVAIDGQRVAGPPGTDKLNATWFRSHPGDIVEFEIHRAGAAQPLIIRASFRAIHGAGDTLSLARRGAIQVLGFYPLLFLVVGLSVLFLRA